MSINIDNRFVKYRLYGYPLVAVLLYLLFILINPIEGFFASYSTYKFQDYLNEIGYLLLFTALTSETGIATTRLLDKNVRWDNKPVQRIVLQLLLQITALIILFVFLIIVAEYFTPTFVSPKDELLIRQAVVLGILVSILNTAFFTAEHFLLNWNSTKLQAEILEKKALEFELSALRTQIDPHFLFNNFSTLTALIEEDTPKALEYLEKLSSVYRYLLTFRNKHLATLFDESMFIYSYLYLYQVRYGKNLTVMVDISADIMMKKLPPLSLQLLMENAVKHNTISASEPLHIKIFSMGLKSLVVENNINPKTTIEASTGLGLNNIDQRYKLLDVASGITVNHTNKIFQVILPLLDNEN